MSELYRYLSLEAIAEIERLIDEHVEAGLAAIDRAPRRRWLSVKEAAVELACSPDAVRMRVKRGRLDSQRQGRRLYVSAESVNRLESTA